MDLISNVRRFSADAGASLARGWARLSRVAAAGGRGGYDAARMDDSVFESWIPGLEAAEEEGRWGRDLAVARMRDLEANDGWAAAALERQADQLGGQGMRPQVQADQSALGWDAAQAGQWNRAVEREWRRYVGAPNFALDAARQASFDELLCLMFAHDLRDGECLGAAVWRPARASLRGWGTRLAVIDPDRLSTPDGRTDGPTLRRGVEVDADGAPIAYHIRDAHPHDRVAPLAARTWSRYPRLDELGLPVTLHAFRRRRAGQVRGRSQLAPIARVFRQLGKFAAAEIDAAVVQALVALTVESSESAGQIAERLGGMDKQALEYETRRAEFYSKRPPTFGRVRAAVLRPGDRVAFNASSRPAQNFNTFTNTLLGQVAANLGTSLEALTLDYSRTNYSSARAARLEVMRWLRARRTGMIQGVVNPFFFVWLSETIDNGYLTPPPARISFEAAPELYARVTWLSGAPGNVDPVKEAEGAALRIQNGVSSLAQECGEAGLDWEENLEQLAREVEAYRARGLLHPQDRAALAPSAPPVEAPPAAAPGAPA